MIDFRLVSCLNKVFWDEAPTPMTLAPEGLIGEECAFQVAWRALDQGFQKGYVYLTLDSPIAAAISVYRVRHVPVNYAWIPCKDMDYLRTQPGLYPDALEPLQGRRLRAYSNRWESAWVEIVPPADLEPGSYPIVLTLTDEAGNALCKQSTVYTLHPAKLSAQRLIHTRWFHCDALCNYYDIEMFSEEFWRVCENFVRAAADMSINCLLTPIHTPPLDTREGGYRRTCQLVDVRVKGGGYQFGFEKLERWVQMARRCGIEYFEMAHFFTQWGARHAPQIVAEVDGSLRRIFGWDTDATGEAYRAFLNSYIPALRGELARLGILDKCFFHISDEPNLTQLEDYRRARDSVKEALCGLKVIDALSNIDFYLNGVVEKPVPASNHIEPFLEAQVPGLWTYYCVGQYENVSNAFIAMPAARTRAIGLALFKYGIEGFLQWGFNFYSSQYSDYPVDPWLITDGDGFSPAGDCFIVYPARDGSALPSLRSKLFKQAVQDMRALDALASTIGHERAVELMEQDIPPISFSSWPRNADFILQLRKRVNEALDQALKNEG